ncbi:MAG: GNAT family N-acetyltransferase [Prevotella sp.]|nr:GNAT family N-acetyltransferase [Prevotella sp.]
MITLQRYTSEKADEWNRFVARSKNGTFLLDRRYMDYHGDRFADHSLMVYRKGRLSALLPANVQGDTLYSHQGLTYGGLVTDSTATTVQVMEMFRKINHMLAEEGISRVVYKPIPWIYHRMPAEEDLYALFAVCHTRLIARDVSSAIAQQPRLPFTESRRSGMRKASAAGISISEANQTAESQELAAFWHILDDNLCRNHGVRPVHSLAEMQLLAARFPDSIRLFTAKRDDLVLGGTLIFETPQAVHTQYISASEEGKRLGVLDRLFDFLIHKRYSDAHCIDFGKSTSTSDCTLNASLIFQKEGFGGRAVCYDTYEWATSAEK